MGQVWDFTCQTGRLHGAWHVAACHGMRSQCSAVVSADKFAEFTCQIGRLHVVLRVDTCQSIRSDQLHLAKAYNLN